MDGVTPGFGLRLINAAKGVCGEFELANQHFSAGSVAAALITTGGNIYTGICLDLACGIGFCAEHAAIADMLKARETKIVAIVAVRGDRVLPPCGRCRELMVQVDRANWHTQVYLSDDHCVSLQTLLPQHWLEPKG